MFQEDKDVVLAAVGHNGFALQYAALALQKDAADPYGGQYADGFAIEFGFGFGFAAPALKEDKDFMLRAVAQSGNTLQYAAPAMQEDKDVVLAAVAQNGDVLQFAAPALKEDKDVVLAAVGNNGFAL